MTTIFARMLLAVCLTTLLFVQCDADDAGYWSLRLPVPKSASNPIEETNLDFLTKKVSFDWRGKDASEIREFYSQYFESIGWKDPMADSPGFSDLNASGWSSYNMRFDHNNKPLAVYGTMWKATNYPAFGSVMVVLNGLEDDELFGSVVVQTTPEVDTSAIFRLTGLIGNDPKNLFKLHNAVHGNPFELHTIALPANYEDESDPLLAEYYQIVDEIRATYENWKSEYISQ
jgi:hypothetical protein